LTSARSKATTQERLDIVAGGRKRLHGDERKGTTQATNRGFLDG